MTDAEQHEKDIRSLQAKNRKLSRVLKSAGEKSALLEARLKEAEDRGNSLEKDLEKSNSLISEKDEKEKKTESDLSSLKSELAKKDKILSNKIFEIKKLTEVALAFETVKQEKKKATEQAEFLTEQLQGKRSRKAKLDKIRNTNDIAAAKAVKNF